MTIGCAKNRADVDNTLVSVAAMLILGYPGFASILARGIGFKANKDVCKVTGVLNRYQVPTYTKMPIDTIV